MTDPEFVKDLVKDLKYLESLIKKLEERIITLENFQSLHHTWMARKDNVAGEEYWEHG